MAKTWRRTFRQKNMPKRLRLKTFAEHIRGTFYALHHYYINGLIVCLQFQNSTNWYYFGFVFGFLQTGPNQFVENQKQTQHGTFRHKKFAETSRVFFAETSCSPVYNSARINLPYEIPCNAASFSQSECTMLKLDYMLQMNFQPMHIL